MTAIAITGLDGASFGLGIVAAFVGSALIVGILFALARRAGGGD